MTKVVTVIAARAVAAGREEEFDVWARQLTESASNFAGFLGWGLFRPVDDNRVWDVVYRFDTVTHLEEWERSEVRAGLLDKGSSFMRTIASRRLDGLEAWLEPLPAPGAPPRWKTFVITAVVISVLQTAISSLARVLIEPLPMLVRALPVIIIVVALMTWVVMPNVSKLLSGWLYRDTRSAE